MTRDESRGSARHGTVQRVEPAPLEKQAKETIAKISKISKFDPPLCGRVPNLGSGLIPALMVLAASAVVSTSTRHFSVSTSKKIKNLPSAC